MKHNRIKFDHLRHLSVAKNEFKDLDHRGHMRTYRFLAKLPGVPFAFVAMYIFPVKPIINYSNYRYGKKTRANHRSRINRHLQNL